MWHKCSYPGCRQLATDTPGPGYARGKCEHHGRWRACVVHTGSCPTCTRERDVRRAEEVERQSRQRIQEQREKDERIQTYVAEYLRQGYAPEAAEALTEKRLRDEEERAQQEATERYAAEQERRRAVGEIARCPVCKRDVPASQGVILKHGGTVEGLPCTGTGTIVSPLKMSGNLPTNSRKTNAGSGVRERPQNCKYRGQGSMTSQFPS